MTNMPNGLPVWAEREMPDLQVADSLPVISYGVLLHDVSPAPDSANQDFVEWVNDYRRPMSNELHEAESDSELWLAEQGLNLQDMRVLVAGITGTPVYPRHRVILHDALSDMTSTQDAFDSITPGLHYDDEELINAQFNPMLDVVTLNRVSGEDASLIGLADAVTDTLGGAAIGNIVDVQIQRDPEPAFRFWYGYQWRYGDDFYGGFIQKATTAHIAARARHELGYQLNNESDHPIIRPYRLPEGFYYESGGAVILDLLNQAAGFNDGEPGIHGAIWQFAKNGRDDASRQELKAIVQKATQGRMSLEELESSPIQNHGLPIDLMQRVEEAIELDVSARPSKIFSSLTSS